MNARRHFILGRGAGVAALLVLFFAAPEVSAQRAFTARFSTNQFGNIIFVANTLMTTTNLLAPAIQNLSAGALNNNDYNMQFVDTDADGATTNSSSATLALPGDATVLFAGLYWGADTSAGAAAEGVNGVAAPNAALKNQVKFVTPGFTYNPVSATVTDVIGTRYQCFVDVTAQVRGGGAGSYGVAQVQAGRGADRYAGWSLVVVYQSSTEISRNLTVFDGFNNVSGTAIDINLNGFTTPPAGNVNISLGVVAYEGDASTTGDLLKFGPTSALAVPIGDLLLNPTNPANTFNSSITRLGARVSSKSPDYANQMGFDADVLDASGTLGNSASNGVVNLSTTGDVYLPGVVTTAIQIFAPDVNSTLNKTVTDLNGGYVEPGDTLEYAIYYGNTGQDNATNVIIRDTLPANVTYLTNSLKINGVAKTDGSADDQADFFSSTNTVVFRVGTGAGATFGGTLAPAAAGSNVFRVLVNAGVPHGTAISNYATVSFTAQTLRQNYSGTSPGAVAVVTNQADVTVFKAGPASVTAGSNLTYTVTVSNAGPSSATSLVVTDSLPASVTFVSASGGGTFAGGKVTWPTNAFLAANAATNYTVTVTAPLTLVSFTNIAAAGSTRPDPNPGNNDGSSTNSRAVTTTLPPPFADVIVAKAGPTNALAGAAITYTISVTNSGPAASTNMVVRDTLPAGVIFNSASGGGVFSNGVVFWSALTNFASGGSTNFTVSLTVPAGGTLTNIAAATATTPDPVAANNDGSGAAQRVVTMITPQADVQLFKTGATNALAGTNLAYTILLTNAGPSSASNVVASDTLPGGATFVSASGGGVFSGGVVTWPGVLLTNGQSTNFTVTLVVPGNGPITNTAAASSATGDPLPGNNNGGSAANQVVTTVTPQADILVAKTGPTNSLTGASLSYTITATNLGPSTAQNVVVRDTLPPGFIFVSASGGGTFSGGMVTWPAVGAMTNNQNLSYTVIATAGPSPGNYTNLASSTAATADPQPANNDGSASASRAATSVQLSGVTVSGFVYLDANHNLQPDAGETGTGLDLFAKIFYATNAAGPAFQAVPVNPASGAYAFTNIAAGNYSIIIDDNGALADITPTLPAGWSGTEMPGSKRDRVVVATTSLPNQNFGLINAVAKMGRVFRDDGGGGGLANDGLVNGAETGLANVTVKLTDASGATVYDTAKTDGAGNYMLYVPGSLASGTPLKVVETNPGGFLSTGASVGNTGGTYDRATDTISFNFSTGTIYAGVNFADVPENSFVSDGQQAGLPGTFVTYPHAFTAGSGGQVNISIAATPNPVLNGWSQAIYRDANCNGTLEAGEPLVTAGITLAAGEKLCLLVKEFIPAGAPFNAQDQIVVTATFNFTGANPALAKTYARTDLTTVGNPTTAGLTLVKAVDRANAQPGQAITYTITYANKSSEALGNVVIYDETPAFTTFVSASSGPLPASLTAVAILKPGSGATGAVRWTFTGQLAPGGGGTVIFSAMLNP